MKKSFPSTKIVALINILGSISTNHHFFFMSIYLWLLILTVLLIVYYILIPKKKVIKVHKLSFINEKKIFKTKTEKNIQIVFTENFFYFSSKSNPQWFHRIPKEHIIHSETLNNDKLVITTHLKEFEFEIKQCESLSKIIQKEIEIKPPKHLLVFVNPVSGLKKSKEVYEKISILFKKVGIKLSTIYTKKRYEAQELVKNIDISEYYGIICVSGDGTLNEVVNGLMSRKDSDKAIKIPLGIIPCGSGNGLSKSLGINTPEEAALKIIQGKINSLDLLKVEQNQNTTYAFLIGKKVLFSLNISCIWSC